VRAETFKPIGESSSTFIILTNLLCVVSTPNAVGLIASCDKTYVSISGLIAGSILPLSAMGCRRLKTSRPYACPFIG
jgi:hypothetical protein